MALFGIAQDAVLPDSDKGPESLEGFKGGMGTQGSLILTTAP